MNAHHDPVGPRTRHVIKHLVGFRLSHHTFLVQCILIIFFLNSFTFSKFLEVEVSSLCPHTDCHKILCTVSEFGGMPTPQIQKAKKKTQLLQNKAENYQIKLINKNSHEIWLCQGWDSNSRFRSETRTPFVIVRWESNKP